MAVRTDVSFIEPAEETAATPSVYHFAVIKDLAFVLAGAFYSFEMIAVEQAGIESAGGNVLSGKLIARTGSWLPCIFYPPSYVILVFKSD